MQQYIIRRLLAAIPSLLIVSLVIFSLLRLIPGDAVMAQVADAGYVSEDDLDRMRAELGIDRPFATQYLDWLSHALRGDLGEALWSRRPVRELIFDRVPLSLQMILMAMGIGVVLAIPLGVISAVKQDTPIDYAARFFSIAGLSIPDFWLGTMTLLVLSLYIGWLPEFGWYPPWEDPSRNLQALVFPAAIIGYRLSAVSARMTRSAMLEVMREDYVRTARAKGLRERTVIVKHALRNSLIPVLTIMGSQISFLFGGTVIMESIFTLPGMGRLTFDAVVNRDYPVVQGTVMMMALVFIFVNLVVDLTYAMVDPRIRYS